MQFRSDINRIIFSILIALAIASTGLANDAAEKDAQENKKPPSWSFKLPIWVPSYSGDFAIGDTEFGGEPADNIWSRLFDSGTDIDLYFSAIVTYAWERWKIQGYVLAGKFNQSVTFTLSDEEIINVSINPIIPRFYGSYRLADWGQMDGQSRVELWLLGGIRYYSIEVTLPQTEEVGTLGRRADWFDPILGIIIPYRFSPRWKLEVSGDVGGFGVGSKLSWLTIIELEYKVSRLFGIELGWNSLNIDYEGTVQNERFVYDAIATGPTLTFGFHF